MDVKLNIISVVSGVIESVDEGWQQVTVRYTDDGSGPGPAQGPGQGPGAGQGQGLAGGGGVKKPSSESKSATVAGGSAVGGSISTDNDASKKLNLTGPQWPGKIQIERPVREQALGKYVIMDKEGDVRGMVTRIEGQGKNIQVQLLDDNLRLEDGQYSWVSYAGKGADGMEMLWYIDKDSALATAALSGGGGTTVATFHYLSHDIAWMKPPPPTPTPVAPPVTAFSLAKAMPDPARVPDTPIPSTSPAPTPVKPPTTPAPPLAEAGWWSVELKGADVQDEAGKWQEEYYPANIGNHSRNFHHLSSSSCSSSSSPCTITADHDILPSHPSLF